VRRPLAAFSAVACLLALAGCGIGAGPAPKAVQLLVTRDFGAHVLHTTPDPRIAGQETVMSLLLRNFSVSTRYGGGFVSAIDGVTGGEQAGHSLDWFYYVNGIEAPKGAAATDVHPGDHIWWDLHDWSQTDDVPAVVGSYPEPFLNGTDGKRLPVRVECSTDAGSACHTVTSALQAAGVPAATSALGSGGGVDILRVLVGSWQALRADTDVAPIEHGPRASGVYATFSEAGRELTLLDADGRRVRTLTAAGGLIAATATGEDAPAWVVTGTDPEGVRLAAADFDEQALRNQFAVAVTSAGSIGLPVAHEQAAGAG
jgi:Domain of unknown function (DUF4430)